MQLLPTHYFSKQDLEPNENSSPAIAQILDKELLESLQRIGEDIRDKRSCEFQKSLLITKPEISLFIGILRLVGAINITEYEDKMTIVPSGHLASDLPFILFLYLKHGYTIFDDWNRRTKTLPDRLTALEFLHFIEKRRIESSKKAGLWPDTIRTIPVSYAIIKAKSVSLNSDVYLFELNKDWGLFNLIGGKQEPVDNEDYRLTLLRELEEEIGVSRDRVIATQLLEKPLDGYSLSGSRGTLIHYPCMLYSIKISGLFTKREKDRWLKKEEILIMSKLAEPKLMVNKVYLSYLFHDLHGGLDALPLSIESPIDKGPWYHEIRNFILSHHNWLVPMLKIIAALLAIVAGIFAFIKFLK
ncbi:MAG: hypothetical protein KKB34_18895 [Bacteroidetes bacterium]|nr:hypothetical protein [Bacteroidota bacterium]